MALPETPVIVKPTEVLDQAVGVDSDTSKDNGIADYKGGPGGPGGNRVNQWISLKQSPPLLLSIG